MMRRFIFVCAIAVAAATTTLATGAAQTAELAPLPAATSATAAATTPTIAPSSSLPPAAALSAPILPPAAAPLRAATPPAASTAGVTTGPAAGSLLQTIFALSLVLGLLACLAWFLKRYGPKAQAGSANLRLVGSLNLGGRERILVVEVGDQWIVVGASPGRVNALATMARQPGAEAGGVQTGATLHPHQTPAASFAAWLKQTIDKRHAP